MLEIFFKYEEYDDGKDFGFEPGFGSVGGSPRPSPRPSPSPYSRPNPRPSPRPSPSYPGPGPAYEEEEEKVEPHLSFEMPRLEVDDEGGSPYHPTFPHNEIYKPSLHDNEDDFAFGPEVEVFEDDTDAYGPEVDVDFLEETYTKGPNEGRNRNNLMRSYSILLCHIESLAVTLNSESIVQDKTNWIHYFEGNSSCTNGI